MSLITTLLASEAIDIRSVAQVISHMVSNLSAVEYGPLYYHILENDKTIAFSKNKGNYQASMVICKEAKIELRWWLEELQGCFKIF